MIIRVEPKNLGKVLRKQIRKMPQGAERGARRAALRAVRTLAKRTPVGVSGHMKQSWEAGGAIPSEGVLATVHNSAPYAGVIELGARPHPVGREAIEAIALWAQRKLGIPEDEATGVAFAIADKLAVTGQKGQFIVRDALPELEQQLGEEIRRSLDQLIAEIGDGD